MLVFETLASWSNMYTTMQYYVSSTSQEHRYNRLCVASSLSNAVSLQLVQLLAQHKVHERLRSAREVFAAKFPLTEQLWLAWIADTLDEVAQGTVPPEALLSLAEQSLHDYLSVSLWQQYLTYALFPRSLCLIPRACRLA